MKYSRQRELIVDAVRSRAVHPTADAVYDAVRQQDPKISLGTVYRNLNQLSECGMLLKLTMPNGGDRFDGRLDSHLHIICDHCGKVRDVELESAQDIDREVERQTGYEVTTRTIVFSGVCADCRIEN